ncbi:DUF2087 domain-containing protein [Streptomyces sp. NBC_01102]|uniref:DUF2087 domain-containing protein n=1 Tax=Streptomyces sp. NBC_01102 TaxID=2903749 RepID=UPI00386C1F70|nr:DUF2087 domain-containing protein [Streptomyces sp. NBC_01102]
MSDTDTRSSHQVTALFSRGRLTAIPRKVARREQLLEHLAQTLFERDRVYTEREVNEALLTVHEDCSALRRCLVVAGLLVRPKDGSSYRRGR